METHLFLPDQHFPFADWDAISVAHAIGTDAEPDSVILGGDSLDFSAASRYSDAQVLEIYQHTLQDELNQAAAYMRETRRDFPKAAMRYFRASHEWRMAKHTAAHAAAYQHLDGLQLKNQLPFTEVNCTLHNEPRIYLAKGRAVCKHGSRYGKYAAANELRDEGRGGMSAHNHKTQTATENHPDMPPKVWESVGCLCDLDASYHKPHGKPSGWNHGFGIIYVDGHDYKFDNIIIDRGVAYWRGTRYSAA